MDSQPKTVRRGPTAARTFPCPVNVSPLIRASRWFALSTGVGYGAFRASALQRHEDERKRLRKAAQTDGKPPDCCPPNESAAVQAVTEVTSTTPLEVTLTTSSDVALTTTAEVPSTTATEGPSTAIFELPTSDGWDTVIVSTTASTNATLNTSTVDIKPSNGEEVAAVANRFGAAYPSQDDWEMFELSLFS